MGYCTKRNVNLLKPVSGRVIRHKTPRQMAVDNCVRILQLCISPPLQVSGQIEPVEQRQLFKMRQVIQHVRACTAHQNGARFNKCLFFTGSKSDMRCNVCSSFLDLQLHHCKTCRVVPCVFMFCEQFKRQNSPFSNSTS
jgi:hypothetical protein